MFKFLQNKRNKILLSTIIVGLFIFLRLLDSVIEIGRVTILDTNFANFILTIRTELLTQIMLTVTSLGSEIAVIIASVILISYLYYKKHKRHAFIFILILVAQLIFIFLAKEIVARPRPDVPFAIINENNFSFPSGHALFAVSFYGVAILYLARTFKEINKKRIIQFVGYLLVLMICFSRIYLGVHWLSDVIASMALGISWVALVLLFEKNT